MDIQYCTVTKYLLVGTSWFVMILCGLRYWSPNRFFYVSILVFAGGFLIWMLIGIPILAGVPSLLLNYVTKVAAFAAVASLYFKRQVLVKPLEAVQ